MDQKWTMNPYLKDLLGLLYPTLCYSCKQCLPSGKEPLCLSCQVGLPKTDFHLYQENPLTERFWGRMRIVTGASLYYFGKEGRVQNLIHQLKYKGKKEIGYHLGLMYGQTLIKHPLYRAIDLIIPVPIHVSKKRKRGYNQSDYFASGLSQGMKAPWSPNILKKVKKTDTQTVKSRLERFQNVSDTFEVVRPKEIANKSLLLVDDVMTTGATMEACGHKLLACEKVRLSLATIAFAAD